MSAASADSLPADNKQGIKTWLTGNIPEPNATEPANAQNADRKQSISAMPRGPYAVGYCDLELVRCENFNIRPDTHLVGRLFYPCALPEDWHKNPKPMPWLPSSKYVDGYVEFLFWQSKSWRMSFLKQLAKAAGYWESNVLYINYVQGAEPLQPRQTDGPTSATGVPAEFPVVVFSHGIGSCRSTYSLIAGDLASRGMVVLCVEHCDGTAAGAKLAKDWGWKFFEGQLGNLEVRYSKTRHRITELRTAISVLNQLNKGDDSQLTLLDGLTASQSFKGRLDLSRIVLMGHSYGGGTVACLAAEEPQAFSCCVALDPWWPAIPPEHLAFKQGPSGPAGAPGRCPFVCVSSEDWNTPNMQGELTCGKKEQEALLKAFSANGALVSAIKYSQHNASSDILPLFGESMAWILKQLGFQNANATPLELLLRITNAVCLNLAHSLDWYRVAPMPRDYIGGGMPGEAATAAANPGTGAGADASVDAKSAGSGVVDGNMANGESVVAAALEGAVPGPPEVAENNAEGPSGALSSQGPSQGRSEGPSGGPAGPSLQGPSQGPSGGPLESFEGPVLNGVAAKPGSVFSTLPKPVRKPLTQDFLEWQRCRFQGYVSHFVYNSAATDAAHEA